MILTHNKMYSVNLWELRLGLISQLEYFHKKIGLNNDLVLHCGVEGIHSESGYHPLGMAVDLHIERGGEVLGIREQYEMAVLHWIGGIGVYPWWITRGLHLDLGNPQRRWFRDVGGNYFQITDLKWEDV